MVITITVLISFFFCSLPSSNRITRQSEVSNGVYVLPELTGTDQQQANGQNRFYLSFAVSTVSSTTTSTSTSTLTATCSSTTSFSTCTSG